LSRTMARASPFTSSSRAIHMSASGSAPRSRKAQSKHPRACSPPAASERWRGRQGCRQARAGRRALREESGLFMRGGGVCRGRVAGLGACDLREERERFARGGWVSRERGPHFRAFAPGQECWKHRRRCADLGGRDSDFPAFAPGEEPLDFLPQGGAFRERASDSRGFALRGKRGCLA
jgi:hypothetical protein